jgi:hypothetical protein
MQLRIKISDGLYELIINLWFQLNAGNFLISSRRTVCLGVQYFIILRNSQDSILRENIKITADPSGRAV